ncbi:MAG: hypothetical protein IH851_00410 [Armatimonadetes bacterium]|nr:hypothetical protein [Armatimonadota bacterium]
MIALLAACLALSSAQSPADLKADVRLATPVTVRADAEMVGSLLERLSERLDVPLKVQPRIEQDLIVIYAANRPAHEILTVIAEHFGWEWQEEEEGYRLIQTPDARREEERQLRELILEPYLKIGEGAKKALNVSESERERLRNRAQEIGKRLGQLPDWEELETWMPEYEEWSRLRRDLREMILKISPTWMLVNTVLAEMTPDDWLALDRQNRLVFSLKPTVWQRPFSGNARAAAMELIQEAAAVANAPDPIAAPSRGFFSVQADREFGPEDVATVRLIVSNVGSGPRHKGDRILLRNSVALISIDGSILATDRVFNWLTDPRPPFNPSAVKKPPDHPRMTEPLSPSPGLRHANGLSPVRNGFSVASDESRTGFLQVGSKTDVYSDLPRLLNEVAVSAGICVIADRYDTGPNPICPIETRTLGIALGSVAYRGRYEWEFDGTWARFRTDGWPLDRACTFPRKTLFAFRDRVIGNEGYTLDDLASLASAVTDRQATSNAVGRVLTYDWYVIVGRGGGMLYLLRAWAQLGEAQKQALLRGGPLVYGTLSPGAKRMLEEAIYRLDRAQVADIGLLFQEDDPDLDWLRENWRYDPLQRGRPEDEITQLLPNGVPQDTEIRLRTTVGPAIWMMDNWGRLHLRGLAGAASWLYYNERNTDSWALRYTFRPAERRRHFFTITPGRSAMRGAGLVTAKALAASPFAALSGLPEELRKELERLKEEIRRRAGGEPPPKMEMTP